MAFDINADLETGESNAPETKTYTLRVTDYVLKEDKYIEIGLDEINGLFDITTRAYLNKKGLISLYDSFVGSDGKKVPASLLFELKEAIRAKLGEVKYTERKTQSKGINAKFFLGAEFDFEVKTSGGYHFLMTEYQKQKDEEYGLEDSSVDSVADKQEKALTDSGLPF